MYGLHWKKQISQNVPLLKTRLGPCYYPVFLKEVVLFFKFEFFPRLATIFLTPCFSKITIRFFLLILFLPRLCHYMFFTLRLFETFSLCCFPSSVILDLPFPPFLKQTFLTKVTFFYSSGFLLNVSRLQLSMIYTPPP